jgi:Secretion system C-terminal sorting domain
MTVIDYPPYRLLINTEKQNIMKTSLQYMKNLALGIVVSAVGITANAQTCEWRLGNVVHSGVDPDGAGPATGTVAFTLQLHTTAGTIPNVNVISVGWNWQSANAMVPTAPGCATVSAPANVTMSSAFATAGFAYTVVFQCGVFNQTAGGQNFDRRAVGTIDNGLITLTTAWTDVFTVTLWTLGVSSPQGGYATINSGSGGAPAQFPTYAVADDAANEYVVNSLTYSTALPLGSGVLPVTLTDYNVQCTNNGASLTWKTASESNSSHFVIQKSNDGNNWSDIGSVLAAGNSSNLKAYQYFDISGGTAFYRLKQVDKDGRFTYTEIRRTNCDGKQLNVLLFPVPAKDKLNVAVKSDKTFKTELVVYDATGRLVMKQSVTIASGSNNFSFDVTRLAAGEYMLSSTDPSVQINKKFVVAK